MRCWPHPIALPGSGVVTMPSSCVALQTGLRASELINLRRCDIVTGTGAHIRCEGKGRKQRCTPLRQETLKVLEVWLRERAGTDSDPLFPTIRGTKLSRDALECLVRRHTLSASTIVPIADRKTGKSACPQTQHGDGAAAPWRRSIGDRALARA